MNKVQKTFILPAIWALKIALFLSILNATNIFSKLQFKGEQESKQFANGASLPEWTTFQMGFYVAPPTLSWPKRWWPNNSFLYCIVLMQNKWHSSGPFSCNSLAQNTSVFFLPVELAYVNSNTFRLISWQTKADTGGEDHGNLVTRHPSLLCLSS